MVRTLRKDIARYNRDDDIVSEQFLFFDVYYLSNKGTNLLT